MGGTPPGAAEAWSASQAAAPRPPLAPPLSERTLPAEPLAPPAWTAPPVSPPTVAPPRPVVGEATKSRGLVAPPPAVARSAETWSEKFSSGDDAVVDRLGSWLLRWRQTPSWLISLVFHLTLLLVLALIPLHDFRQGTLTVLLGKDAGARDLELQGLSAVEVQPSEDTSLEPLVTMQAARLDLPERLITDVPLPLLSKMGQLTNRLQGRRAANKSALLSKGGGSAATENAVEMGLEWLARNQRSDGSWSLKGPYADGAASENPTAATAMALNAFLGAGYTQQEGKYADRVQRGLDFLLRRQKSDGFFADGEPSHHRAYAQAIATLTVLEAYGLTEESRLRGPAEKAVQYAQWAQSSLGGWRYQPRADADVSVTGWFVMALETANMLGFEVDHSTLDRVHGYLDSVAHRNGSAYAYNDLHQPDLTMTAEALLCRMLLGWPRTQPALDRGIQDLSRRPPMEREPVRSVYYWYYATQVLHHYGGPEWEQWNEAMKRVLPALQQVSGPERGSWSSQQDAYGTAGGRLYTTCLSIYCLEVYYRHLAIYSIN